MQLRNHPSLKIFAFLFVVFAGFFYFSGGKQEAPEQKTVTETTVVTVKDADDAASDTAAEERLNLHNQMQGVLSKMATLQEKLDDANRFNEKLSAEVEELKSIPVVNEESDNQEPGTSSTNPNVGLPFSEAISEGGDPNDVLNLQDYNVSSGDSFKSERTSNDSTGFIDALDNDPIDWIGEDTSFLDKFKEELSGTELFDNTALAGGGTKEEKHPVIQYATIDPEAVLFDAFVFDALFGVSPNQTQALVPFRFKLELSSENLMTSNIKLPQIRTMRMSGFVVGEWSTSCVKGYITSATFVFADGMISTVGSSENEAERLGYITDEYGEPCIQGDKYSSLNEYAAIHGGLSSLSSVASALSNAQFDTEDSLGGATQVFNGSQTKLAIGDGVSGGLTAISDTIAARYANVRDFVIARPETVIVQLNKAIPIDYDTSGRKILNERFEQQLQEYYETSNQSN